MIFFAYNKNLNAYDYFKIYVQHFVKNIYRFNNLICEKERLISIKFNIEAFK